jgi:hypothetical protein
MCSRGRDLGGKRFVCNSQCMNYHPARIAPNFIVPDVVATAKYYSMSSVSPQCATTANRPYLRS